MAFSLRKRVKSKPNIASGCDDDTSVLGEVLDRSTKRSKSKKKSKKYDKYLEPGQINNGDSDLDLGNASSSSEQPIVYRTECPCESHYDKQLVERSYELNIDKLFDLMFGTNEFIKTYRQAQRFYDDTATEWTKNEETKCRERVLNYKLPFESTLVGKGTIITREKQILVHDVPKSHYVIETEVSNEGVRYSSTFSLFIRYCLVQTSPITTNLRITAQVRFCKAVNAIVKQLIEKNAYSASQESLRDLNARLNLVTNFQIEKSRPSRGEITLNVPSLNGEHGRPDAFALTAMNQSLTNSDKKSDSSQSSFFIHSDKIMSCFIIIIGFLILFHLYLYLKLRHMDVLIDNLSHMLKLATSARH